MRPWPGSCWAGNRAPDCARTGRDGGVAACRPRGGGPGGRETVETGAPSPTGVVDRRSIALTGSPAPEHPGLSRSALGAGRGVLMRVAIIGAGPAGLFLGSALAGRGHDVLAVD